MKVPTIPGLTGFWSEVRGERLQTAPNAPTFNKSNNIVMEEMKSLFIFQWSTYLPNSWDQIFRIYDLAVPESDVLRQKRGTGIGWIFHVWCSSFHQIFKDSLLEKSIYREPIQNSYHFLPFALSIQQINWENEQFWIWKMKNRTELCGIKN